MGDDRPGGKSGIEKPREKWNGIVEIILGREGKNPNFAKEIFPTPWQRVLSRRN